MAARGKRSTDRLTHGIGEWYGRSFVHLTPQERATYAKMQFLPKEERPPQPCIPRLAGDPNAKCTKEGGVCSLSRYRLEGATGEVSAMPDEAGVVCTVCPYRFYEAQRVFAWIGESILGVDNPLIAAVASSE